MKRKSQNDLPEIHEVKFHNQILQTLMVDDVEYTALKPIVEGMGLDWEAQRQLVERDAILSKGACIIQVPSNGGTQKTLCLPLKFLNGWLFKINASRYKNKFQQECIIQYQLECYDALHSYWHKGTATNSRFFDENSGVGLLDESARNSNVVHYSVAGLCREADRFLGGKTALKALNFFTGMPVDDLLKDLEESKKEKEACGVTGFTSRPPATVLEFISSHCSFGPDKTVTKNELYQAYLDYCETIGEHPEGKSMFFKVLMNHPKANLNAKQCRKGHGAGSRYYVLIGIGLKEVVEN